MNEHSAPAAMMSLMIPIFGIVFGIGFVMLAAVLDYRRRREMFELHHKERMALIEKGIDVPPLPADFFQTPRKLRSTPADLLRRGLLLLFVGAALMVALASEVHGHPWWGLLPVAMGLAYLVAYFVERRTRNVGP